MVGFCTRFNVRKQHENSFSPDSCQAPLEWLHAATTYSAIERSQVAILILYNSHMFLLQSESNLGYILCSVGAKDSELNLNDTKRDLQTLQKA